MVAQVTRAVEDLRDLIFVFLCVHEAGSPHYTYSEVPTTTWAEGLIGVTITELFGFSRNHFDRMEHFFYGLLLCYPMREALSAPRC